MKGRRGSVAKPLLEDEHALEKFPNDEPADLCTRYIQRTKGQVLKRLLPWIIHGAILVLSSFMFLAIFLPSIHSSAFCNDRVEANKPHLPLPASQGLRWEDRRFPTNIVDNPFAGPPRTELENVWHDLLKNDNIRVPIAYLEEKNLTSVYTRNHSEGIASLSVYHSLHCLKKVKRMMFKEYYYQDKNEAAMAREIKHADHCVEYIRESLMCKPDLSLVTFRWINNTAQHDDPTEFYPTNFDADTHHCANWQHLDHWAGEHAFDLF